MTPFLRFEVSGLVWSGGLIRSTPLECVADGLHRAQLKALHTGGRHVGHSRESIGTA